jgi:hypothetical protein
VKTRENEQALCQSALANFEKQKTFFLLTSYEDRYSRKCTQRHTPSDSGLSQLRALSVQPLHSFNPPQSAIQNTRHGAADDPEKSPPHGPQITSNPYIRNICDSKVYSRPFGDKSAPLGLATSRNGPFPKQGWEWELGRSRLNHFLLFPFQNPSSFPFLFKKNHARRAGAPSSKIGWRRLKQTLMRRMHTGSLLGNASLKPCLRQLRRW